MGKTDTDKNSYKIIVTGGKGVDEQGVVRDYGKWVMDGTIIRHQPTKEYRFAVWDIYDRHGKFIRTKDWGRNEGAPVYPDCVKVRFGKTGYVEVGYQRRKDGTFYGFVTERFGDRAVKQRERYIKSTLFKRISELKQCPEWDSLCYGIHLPDETKAAYKAAIDEAFSGEYEVEFLRDEI